MTVFPLLKLLHVGCALLSILGFALRGYWAVTDNPLRKARLARVLPHLVDTLLLGSAVGMLLVWEVPLADLPWVVAKLAALLVYISLGMVVMRFAQTQQTRITAYIAALLTAGYIVATAFTHSPWGPLALIG